MSEADPKLLKYLSEKPVDYEGPTSRFIRKYVPQSVLDKLINLRYGRDEAEKAKVQKTVPGYTVPSKFPEDYDREDRRESGYFFGKNWPLIAKGAVGLTNKLRYTLGEKDPKLHDLANKSADIGMSADNSLINSARSGVKALGNYIPKEMAQNAIEGVGFGSELLNFKDLNTLNFNDDNMRNLQEGVEQGGEEVENEDENTNVFSKRNLLKGLTTGLVNRVPGLETANSLARLARGRKYTY